MKRLLATAALCTAALLAPQGAQAKIVELGGKIPPAKVSCPDNCQAVGRVTGYEGRGATVAKPFVTPHTGKIVAFTVRLGAPDANQQQFFNDLYGGPPKVQLSILTRSTKRKTYLDHKLVAQSDPFDVSNFFGSAPTFILSKPLQVKPRYIVALTVPTWAPAFAVSLGRDYWWRSSRTKGKCDNVSQMAPLTKLQSIKTFGCTYFTARLYYTATYVPDNQPTTKTPTTKTPSTKTPAKKTAGSARIGARTAKGA